MKKLELLFAFIFLSFVTVLAQEPDVEKEKELIKEVIQQAYADGLCNNADEAAVSKGFHPGFELVGIGQGNRMWKHPIYNWIEDAKAGKKKGKKYSFQDELTTIKFQFVDVAGTAAVAKIEFYEGGKLSFYDYLSLLKFESGWKLVSKIFYAIPKEEKSKN